MNEINYEAIARAAGWADFEDAEDATLLVVAHDDRSVHFTGPNAWKEAVEYDVMRKADDGACAGVTP